MVVDFFLKMIIKKYGEKKDFIFRLIFSFLYFFHEKHLNFVLLPRASIWKLKIILFCQDF
jgi:hypothetical protein